MVVVALRSSADSTQAELLALEKQNENITEYEQTEIDRLNERIQQMEEENQFEDDLMIPEDLPCIEQDVSNYSVDYSVSSQVNVILLQVHADPLVKVPPQDLENLRLLVEMLKTEDAESKDESAQEEKQRQKEILLKALKSPRDIAILLDQMVEDEEERKEIGTDIMKEFKHFGIIDTTTTTTTPEPTTTTSEPAIVTTPEQNDIPAAASVEEDLPGPSARTLDKASQW